MNAIQVVSVSKTPPSIQVKESHHENATVFVSNASDCEIVPEPVPLRIKNQNEQRSPNELSAMSAMAIAGACDDKINVRRASAVSILDPEEERIKTSAKMQLLNDWRCMAHNYKWLHLHSSRFYQTRNLVFAIPVIALSTMSGALTLIVGCGANEILHYTVGFMSLTAAALSTAHNILRYGERSGMHKNSADGFDDLAREIAVETVIHDTTEKTYANLTEFIKMCNDRLSRLVEHSPTIPDKILRRLKAYQDDAANQALSPRRQRRRSFLDPTLTIKRSMLTVPPRAPHMHVDNINEDNNQENYSNRIFNILFASQTPR